MTAVSLSMALGKEGLKLSDVTVGTSAPGTGDFEFRANLTDSVNSNTIRRVDMVKALLAFKWVVESMGIYSTAGND